AGGKNRRRPGRTAQRAARPGRRQTSPLRRAGDGAFEAVVGAHNELHARGGGPGIGRGRRPRLGGGASHRPLRSRLRRRGWPRRPGRARTEGLLRRVRAGTGVGPGGAQPARAWGGLRGRDLLPGAGRSPDARPDGAPCGVHGRGLLLGLDPGLRVAHGLQPAAPAGPGRPRVAPQGAPGLRALGRDDHRRAIPRSGRTRRGVRRGEVWGRPARTVDEGALRGRARSGASGHEGRPGRKRLQRDPRLHIRGLGGPAVWLRTPRVAGLRRLLHGLPAGAGVPRAHGALGGGGLLRPLGGDRRGVALLL
ncbi:MAG: hypothetical protein AVDCRST_MAG01-01-2432, partial [uncultured Rubrobacteraceae bacterium]